MGSTTAIIPGIVVGQSRHPKVAVVVEYPSHKAILRQRHFEGLAEKLVTASLANWGIRDYYLTAAVSSQHFNEVELQQSRDRLLAELSLFEPEKILMIGAVAQQALFGLSKALPITKHRGRGEVLNTSWGEVFTVLTISPNLVLQDPETYRDWAADVEKWATSNSVYKMPDSRTVLLQDVEGVASALRMLRNFSIVSCDTETTGLRFWKDRLVAIGFGVQTPRLFVSYIIPGSLLSDERVISLVGDFLACEDHNTSIVFHNAKFDLQVLMKWSGRYFENIEVEDTLLMSYLLDERGINSKSSPHGLKNLSRVYFDAHDYKWDFEKFWKTKPDKRDWKAFYHYLHLDLIYTRSLFDALSQRLSQEEPQAWSIYRRFMIPASKVLAEMEFKGAPIDVDYLQGLGKEFDEAIDEIREQIKNIVQQFAGDVFPEDFNPNSPKQVAELLYDRLRLPSGKERSTDKKWFDSLKAVIKHPQLIEIIDLIVEYREMQKMKGTYVEGLSERAEKTEDGHYFVHGAFNLAGTGTGRLSSSNPNLQNIPQMKGPQIRRAFKARPGYLWIKCDYSQLEYRIAAFLCQDARMIQAFKDDRDIHIEVASAALGVPRERVSKAERYAAKFIGFGLLYGRGAFSIANGPELRRGGIHWNERQAQKFIDDFLAQFPNLGAWMQNQQRLVQSQQELGTPLGRKRRWPFLTAQGLQEAKREALNFPIQSTASDCTLNGLILLHSKLQNTRTRMILTVHDEIDFETPYEELHTVVPVIADTMSHYLPIDVGDLPIIAEPSVGRNWADQFEWDPTEWNWYYHPETDEWLMLHDSEREDDYSLYLSGPFTPEEYLEAKQRIPVSG